MASQTHRAAQVRNFILHLGRILVSIVIALSFLGVSIPRVQAASETISGKITSAADGSPISGMSVAALDENNNWAGWTDTDGNGDYVLAGLAYGDYRIFACAECNTGTNAFVNTYYHGKYTFESATVITLRAGNNQAGINIALPIGYTIQGTVTDNNAVVIQGIPMAAVMWDETSAQWTWFKSIDTDANGVYQLTGLLVGVDYYVQACPECSGKYYLGEYYNGQRNIEDSQSFNLDSATTQSGVDFTLDPAAIIAGHVSDPDGAALANVPVSADNTVDEANFNVWTDSEGNYSLNVKPGNYHIHTQLNWNGEYESVNLVDQYFDHVTTLDRATSINLLANTTLSGIDFSLTTGNTIQGTVTDTSETLQPLQGIMVAAINWDTQVWLKNVLTDENGNYTLTGLADGVYRIQACPDCTQQPYLSRYYNNTENYDEATPLSVSGSGTESGIDFTLSPAALISGKITSSSDGSAIANVPVQAENSQTGEGFGAWSNENGDYTIYAKPGYYRLRTMVEWNADLDSMNYVDQIYDHALNLEEALLIRAVLNEPETGYDFALQQGGILTGTITDVSDTPLENATVMAVAADGSRRSFGSQPTGADGVYTLRGLPAGDYVLRAAHEGSQALYYGGSANWNRDHIVTITASATTENINFQLAAQGGEDPNLLTMRQSATIADMYDPGWVDFVHNAYLVDQIFSGMARIDPADGSTLSNLSNSWQSTDNIHWTFTLRSGLTWSDGSPLTAADMRFALLRNLKMNGVVDDMMIIQGAQAYSQGTAGADQVGITLDSGDADHVIHFTLTQKVAFFPTLMSTMAARPLPQILIQAFPDSWLSLDKLITSGPYRLIEHDSDHVLLQKNPNFIDAGNVQIEQVVMKSGSLTETAWNQYQNGELDTAVISASNIADVNQHTDIRGQLNMVSQQCTYFIGFNPNQIEATFGLSGDNAALLRRALIESIDRDAFNAQTGSGVITAWTFIAPGVLGHSDESSGIYPAYAPAQALTDIQAAFGGNYTGLPAATLYYPNDVANASTQRAQMEFLANAWNQVLNAHFTVTGISQDQYEAMILSRQMLAVRRGWCSDYNDGYNFLSSTYSMDSIFDGWQNENYDQLLSDAASSSSETERAQIYQNAEEILLRTDAILMPLYYSVSPILSRGFVRSFGVGGVDYIADWTLERTDTMTIETPAVDSLNGSSNLEFRPEGENGFVSYSLPGDAFSNDITVVHTGHLTYGLNNLPEGKQKTSLYFTFQAEDAAHAQVLPAANYTLTVHYTDAEINASRLLETSLALYYWDEATSQWIQDTNSHVDPATNTIVTHSQYEGEWLVLGSAEESQIFMPFVKK